MKANDQAITRQDLTETLEVFGRNLAYEVTRNIITEIRVELDAKLAANSNSLYDRIVTELKDHTEETVGRYNGELLENFATVVEPMRVMVQSHELRLAKLEHQAA